MNILVKSPLMHDKIIDTLSSGAFDGVSFSFIGKKGAELTFSVSGDNAETVDAAAIAKNAIKSSSFGKGIYFSVVQE